MHRDSQRQSGTPPGGDEADRSFAVLVQRLTLLLIVLGLVWRGYTYAWGMPIWADEAFLAVNFIMRDFAGMCEPLVFGQIAPLLFMWVNLAVTKVCGLSEWALHLEPFLAGALGLVLFVHFARAALRCEAALLAIGIFASSYFIVRHSCEMKPYSTDLAISLSLTMLTLSVLEHPKSVRRWVGLTVLATVGVWSSYPSMFVSGTVGLVLTYALMKKRFDTTGLIGWFAYGVLLVGSSLAMYLLYAKPHAEASAGLFDLASWSRTFPPMREPWKLPIWFYHTHLGNMFAYTQGGRAPGSVATFVLFCIGLVRLWRTKRELAMLLVGPFVLTFVAAAMQKYPYGGSARVAQYLAPAICLLTGLGLWSVFERLRAPERRRRALTIAAIVLAVIPIGGMVRVTMDPVKSETVRARHDATLSVAKRTSPDDKWIIFNATEKVPYAPWLGDWRGKGGKFFFDAQRWSPAPIEFAPAPDRIVRESGQRVWLLCYFADIVKVDFPHAQWSAYLEAAKASLGGEPEYESFVIKRGRDREGGITTYESLEVYRFDPPRSEP